MAHKKDFYGPHSKVNFDHCVEIYPTRLCRLETFDIGVLKRVLHSLVMSGTIVLDADERDVMFNVYNCLSHGYKKRGY